MPLVLKGKVVTFEPGMPQLAAGAVYVGDDGLIEAVLPARDPPPPGFDRAARVSSRGVIYPGLIDLHSHIAYNFQRLWTPPRPEPYTRRDQWPREAEYAAQYRRKLEKNLAKRATELGYTLVPTAAPA